MKVVDFYFDPISPYAYLASTQIPDLEREFSIQFCYQPVLFAALLNHFGQKGPAEIPEKRIYTMKDVLRWADTYQVALEGPPTHPFNPLLALRLAAAIEDTKKRNAYSRLLLEYAWGRGKDVSDPQVLEKIVAESGFPIGDLLQQTQSQMVKLKLKENTQRAIEKGIFGVPSFLVEEEIFWGNDRISFLREFLAGKKKINSDRVARILGRPGSANR